MMSLLTQLGIMMASASAPAAGTPLALEIAADTPWAYWRLDEAAGATKALSSVNAKGLTPTGSPTFGVSPLVADGGFALRLNGTTQYLSSTNNEFGTDIAANFNGDKAFTMEAVITPSVVTGATRTLLHIGNYSLSGSQGLSMQVLTDGRLACVMFIGGSFVTIQSAAGLIVAGTKYHVIVNRAVGGAVNMYINAVNVGTGSAPGSISAAAGTGFNGMRPVIGVLFGAAGSGNSTGFYAGDIDHCAIYPTVLSPARVIAHYTSSIAAAATTDTLSNTFMSFSPWGYYKLDLTGTSIGTDSSVNARHGTVGGSGVTGDQSPVFPGSTKSVSMATAGNVALPTFTTGAVGTNKFSLVHCFKTTATAIQHLISADGSVRQWQWRMNNGNIELVTFSPAFADSIVWSAQLNDGQAHMVVLVMDDSLTAGQGTAKLYVDGIYYGKSTNVMKVVPSNTAPPAIGSRANGTLAEMFTGNVDECAIIPFPMTQADVWKLWDARKAA